MTCSAKQTKDGAPSTRRQGRPMVKSRYREGGCMKPIHVACGENTGWWNVHDMLFQNIRKVRVQEGLPRQDAQGAEIDVGKKSWVFATIGVAAHALILCIANTRRGTRSCRFGWLCIPLASATAVLCFFHTQHDRTKTPDDWQLFR